MGSFQKHIMIQSGRTWTGIVAVFYRLIYVYCEFLSLLGTNTERMAGLFACNCLDGFYRTNIFGKCFECEGSEFEGLDCSGDYLDLKPGYWWAWQNYTHKERYRNFTSNINNPAPAYDPGQGQDFIDYTYPMPKPTKCPRERSVGHDQLVTFVTSG